MKLALNHGIGKAQSGESLYGGYSEDDAEHTVVECSHWFTERKKVEDAVHTKLASGNILRLMLETEERWSMIAGMITTVLKNKERDERRREQG